LKKGLKILGEETKPITVTIAKKRKRNSSPAKSENYDDVPSNLINLQDI